MFWFEDSGFANDICKLVFEKYKGLGKKGKPAVGREWTILAAVVVVFEQEGQGKSQEVKFLARGTFIWYKLKYSYFGSTHWHCSDCTVPVH